MDYWHQQTADKPLFPDLLWSRPENKRNAGKLLIIGGNLHSFAAPAEAYSEAVKAGIGVAKVLLPDSLKKLVGAHLDNGEFAPSTPGSGGFARSALAEFIDLAEWADATLLAGDLGRNSETTVLIEQLIQKTKSPLVLTKDSLDSFLSSPRPLLDRPNTTMVLNIAQFQKLCMGNRSRVAVTFAMDLMRLVELMHNLSQNHPCNLVVKHSSHILIASKGQVSSTKIEPDNDIWRVKTAALTAVWLIQNPTKPFEALSSAVIGSVGGSVH